MKPTSYQSSAQVINQMCLLKRKFPTRKLAQEAHKQHRPYLCPFCGNYHLTSRR